jgi:hypothetical protein
MFMHHWSGTLNQVNLETSQVRLGDEHDCDAFVDIFNSIYNRKIDSRYFRWQFLNQNVPTYLILGVSNKNVIGFGGARVQNGHRADGDVLLYQGLDVMILEQYRGKGFSFRNMGDYFIALASRGGAAAIYGLGNRNARLVLTRYLDFKLVVQIQTMISQVNAQPLQNMNTHIERIASFDNQVTEIVSGFLKSHPALLIVRRDPLFLNWRFVSNPVFRYDIFYVKRGSIIFGYLVLKVFEDPATGERFGDIVDLLWVEDDFEMLRGMLGFALGHFNSLGLTQAAIWLQTNTILDEVGRSLGFRATEQRRYLVSKILDPEYNWLRDPKRWYITMADAEIS